MIGMRTLALTAATVLAAAGGAASVASSGPAGATTAVAYPPPTSTTSITMAPAASTTVTTKSNPTLGEILADSRAMTVYTLTNGNAPVLCTGTCATFWPPVTVPAGTSPTAPPGVSGVSTVQNPNGDQVTYQGLPLYDFSQDTTPSDANGEGINSFGGVWHVVKLPACTAGPSSPAPSGKVGRVAGATRDGTAIGASQAAFPNAGSAGAVVLASNANFPDALAGTPLAVAKHGPVLLTTPSGLDPAVATEVSRVLPKGGTVFLLGGSGALASSIDAQVQAMGDVPQRLAGTDRFSTATAIANALGNPSVILEATGTDFADALSAGAAAAKAGGAVLLTNGSTQSPATAAYLSAHPADKSTAVGGPAAAADPSAVAVSGPDRFATAVMVAQHFFTSPATLGFASGLAFPDALAGGGAIGATGGPMLLVPACGSLPSALASYLGSSTGVTSGSLYGGTSAVGDDVLAELESAV